MRFGLVLLLVIAALPTQAQAQAQDPEPLLNDDDLAAYCLGVNGQLAERFRQMQLWGCGKAAGMQWCRDAKASAPEAMRARERLVIRFANVLTRKGLLDIERPPESRARLTKIVSDGSTDARACFNPKGDRDEAACARLQRCEEAEQRVGQ
ncbi:hypothetical protein [uncultured Reyranella sp.]|uniref:hypothetical protein n=1 Tax=uncultured Reyranella sp. TaxID=735512 RepID=UPI0025F620A2|nr:hypothetical protein [uncultured Reyranella sp.]